MAPVSMSTRVIRASHGNLPQLHVLLPSGGQPGALTSLKELLGPNSNWISRFGSSDKLIERLQKAGKTTGDRNSDLARFRWEQITWAALGVVIGVVIGIWSVARGSSPIALIVTMALGVGLGFLLHDKRISGLGKKRVQRIDTQITDLRGGHKGWEFIYRFATCHVRANWIAIGGAIRVRPGNRY